LNIDSNALGKEGPGQLGDVAWILDVFRFEAALKRSTVCELGIDDFGATRQVRVAAEFESRFCAGLKRKAATDDYR